MSDVEAQPTGVSVEQTLDVVSLILDDRDFAAAVAKHNGWDSVVSQQEIAVQFLASRYQWAVTLLSTQTATLKREFDGVVTRLVELEDSLQKSKEAPAVKEV